MCKTNNLLGFLLSRQWRDSPQGISLSFWLTSPEGPVHIIIDNQQAVCFIRRENTLKNYANEFQRKALDLKT